MKPSRLNIAVDRVFYPRADKTKPSEEPAATWYIIGTDQGTCKGEMGWRPEEGERLILEGRWTVYRGEKQFSFTSAIPDVPVEPRDALHYVCERTQGMGAAMEAMIWDQFGENWRDVSEGDLPRFRGALYLRFCETVEMLTREAEKSNAIAWLIGRGATMTMASAAWDRWQEKTVGVVRADCYRLAALPNFGFTHVDRAIRHAFEIGDGDRRRISAAVMYAVNQLGSEGSTTVMWRALRDRANEVLGGVYTQAVCDMVREMFGAGTLRPFPERQLIATGTDVENAEAIWKFANLTPAPGSEILPEPPDTEAGDGSGALIEAEAMEV